MAKNDMTALLAINFVPSLRNAATASRPEFAAGSSHRDVYDFFVDGGRDRLASFTKTLEVAFDSFANVRESFRPRRTLRDTAWKRRDGCYEDTVFVGVDDDAKLHRQLLWAPRR